MNEERAEIWRRGFGKEVEIGKCVCDEYLGFCEIKVTLRSSNAELYKNNEDLYISIYKI